MTPDATEVYLKEYEQVLGTYRFTYQTIWQAGSIFISATAAIAAIALTRDGGVDSAALAAAPLPFVFWWLGVWGPMNRYGEMHSTRAAQLEEILSWSVPGLTMTHFTTFNAKRKEHTVKWFKRVVREGKPRVSEIVNAAGLLMLAIWAALILACIL